MLSSYVLKVLLDFSWCIFLTFSDVTVFLICRDTKFHLLHLVVVVVSHVLSYVLSKPRSPRLVTDDDDVGHIFQSFHFVDCNLKDVCLFKFSILSILGFNFNLFNQKFLQFLKTSVDSCSSIPLNQRLWNLFEKNIRC